MSKRWSALGLAPLAALAISAGPAMAGGAISKPKAPTKAQKAAILKAAKVKGPAKCYSVSLSSSNTWVAGFKFNSKASGCAKYGFDGGALYYGNDAKTTWYLLESGSAEDTSMCEALRNLVGSPAWQDLIPYVDAMGCQNYD